MPSEASVKVRVAIVGSGPAGLSAAAHAAALGLSHVLIEKSDHLSDTIYKYQKGKHVMATPSNLVLRADLDFDAGKRETVLGTWDEQTAAHKVNVHLQRRSDPITGEKGAFLAQADPHGATINAETVILAIGTQGNPNLVRCPVGDLPHVQYQLDDPGEYVDEHIVVIGAATPGSRTRWASPPIRSSATPSRSSIARPNSPPPRTPTSRRCRRCRPRAASA